MCLLCFLNTQRMFLICMSLTTQQHRLEKASCPLVKSWTRPICRVYPHKVALHVLTRSFVYQWRKYRVVYRLVVGVYSWYTPCSLTVHVPDGYVITIAGVRTLMLFFFTGSFTGFFEMSRKLTGLISQTNSAFGDSSTTSHTSRMQHRKKFSNSVSVWMLGSRRLR